MKNFNDVITPQTPYETKISAILDLQQNKVLSVQISVHTIRCTAKVRRGFLISKPIKLVLIMFNV